MKQYPIEDIKAPAYLFVGGSVLFIKDNIKVQKTSTRTRAAFEVAAYDQGAHTTFFDPKSSQFGHKESVKDSARVFGQMYDAIEYRGFSQKTVEELAAYAGVPVFNGLTDEWHPTQMLCDLMTMKESSGKRWQDISFAYVGDARNNMGNSLLMVGAKMGMDVRIGAPKACQPSEALVEMVMEMARESGAKVTITEDPVEAVKITATKELIDVLSDDQYEKPADAPSSMDVVTGMKKGIKLADMYGIPYNDPLWDEFISQLTLSELIKSLMDGGGIAAQETIAAPSTSNGDGPDGIAGNAYVNQSVAASSWSQEMLAQRGYYMGEDAVLNHSAQQVWCPGVDTHRTPFGGRNFEYYSEDANLAYILGGAQTKEMEALGVSVGPKHFFANDQETWRTGVSTYGNEQGFREIQLRAFEGCFTQGGATSVMTGFNRIGPIWVGHYSGVQDGILRGEWGFIGIVITDAAGVNSYMHTVGAIMNGTDMFCYTSGVAADGRTSDINAAIRDNDDGYIIEHLKEINHRIYYTYAHTNLMNGLSSMYDVVTVTPWWQPVVIVINCVFGAAAVGLCIAFVAYAYGKKNKKQEVAGNVQK